MAFDELQSGLEELSSALEELQRALDGLNMSFITHQKSNRGYLRSYRGLSMSQRVEGFQGAIDGFRGPADHYCTKVPNYATGLHVKLRARLNFLREIITRGRTKNGRPRLNFQLWQTQVSKVNLSLKINRVAEPTQIIKVNSNTRWQQT